MIYDQWCFVCKDHDMQFRNVVSVRSKFEFKRILFCLLFNYNVMFCSWVSNPFVDDFSEFCFVV